MSFEEINIFAKKYKNVLVTGGAGAIGGNLTRRLLEGDIKKLVVIDNLSSGYTTNLPKDKRLIFIKGDIAQANVLKRAFRYDINVVFHLAANFANQSSVDNPMRDLTANGLGSVNLLEFANRHKVKKFVYFSTSCIYKNRTIKLKETDLDLQFETPYAISKYMAERYAHFYHRFHGLPIVTLRIFNSYGPGENHGQYRNVIPNFMHRGITNQPLIITGTGKETRNFTYVDDIVRGAILAANTDKANGQVINLGSARGTPILKLAQLIKKITRNEQEIIFVPRRKWDNSIRRDGDLTLAKKILNFTADTKLETGLQKVYDWMREEGITKQS